MSREQKLEEALMAMTARFDLYSGGTDTALIKQARAALSAPKAEAVAWRREWSYRGHPCAPEFTDSPGLAEQWETHPQTDKVIPLYTSPVPAITDEAVYRAVRAHDREDASHRGEPDPWETDYPEEEMADRMFAMRLALLAAFPSKGGVDHE